MVNRFTRPAQHNVVNTQILPRTELLLGALGQRQAKYDQQVERMESTIGTVSGYQVVGDVAKQYLKNKEDMLTEASSNLLSKDLADPSVKGEVNKLISDVANDPTLKLHLSAKASYDKYIEQYEELSKKGKLHENNLHFMNKAWQRYKSTGEFDESLANPIIPEAVDVVKERGNLVSMIKASGADALAYLEDGIAYKNRNSGVDVRRIEDAVQAQLLTYAQSAAGRQERTDYEVLVDKGFIDPSKTSFQKYLKEQVMSTARNYSYNQSSTNIDGALNQSRKEKLKKAEEAATELGYTPAFSSPNAKIKIDEQGRVQTEEVGFFDMINTFGVIEGAKMWMNGDHKVSGKEAKEQTALLQENAARVGVTVTEYVEALNADPNIAVDYYVNKAKRDNESARFYNPKTGGGEFYTRKIYTPEYPQGISAQEYMKEHDISEAEMKSGFTMVGSIRPDNPYTPLGKTALVNGKQVIIDDAPNATPQAQHQWLASQAKYNGKGSTEFEFMGRKYSYIYNPKTGLVEPVKK